MRRLSAAVLRHIGRIAPRSWIDRNETSRQAAILAHYFGNAPSNVPCVIVPDIEETERDVAIAERIIKAYRLASPGHKVPDPDIWTAIKEGQAKFLALLNQDDPRALAEYLCNMNRHDATTGTVQGKDEYDRIGRDPSYRRFIALMTKDKLLSLAEAVGALPCENPEQDSHSKNFDANAVELVKKISRAIGVDISPPEIDGGLLKITIGAASFGERDVNAIFTAHMLRQRGARSVCEIGAGSGRVAYWSYRLGIHSYALVDLPHINSIQAFYLLKALPDAKVRLFGESSGEIDIVPCDVDIARRFDLVLNQDSFPELSHDTVARYLRWIKGHASEFVSINHESKPLFRGKEQLSVPELIEEIGGFSRRSRFPYWLRKGYVVECYDVSASS